ncbi:MAG: hypothetical protein ACJ8KX_07760 [Chthoniobacterales bacterium]
MKFWDRAMVALVLFACLEPARADLVYSVLDLGTLGGTTSAGNALNQDGRVTGAGYTVDDAAQVAFISGANGAAPLQNLGTLGGTDSFGQAIDQFARVAGSSKTADGFNFNAFLSGAGGGSLMSLGTLGGSSSYALGVNSSGQVTGYSQIPGNFANHAYISNAGGGMLHDLGTLTGGSFSFASGINASGQVAGYSGTDSGFSHAFLSESNGGTLHDLGTLGGRVSFAAGVNDLGQVTGRSEVASFGQHAYRSAPNGGPLLDLGTLGGTSSFGQGINNHGDVVGYSYLGDNSTQHAFFYSTTTGMIDLNAHLVPGSGWSLTEARAINDRSQITGVGMIGGFAHGYLLTLIETDFRITSITAVANHHMLIKGLGTPSQSYSIEAANDMRSPFVQLATLNAGADGTLQYEDADAATFPQRYYRFVATHSTQPSTRTREISR